MEEDWNKRVNKDPAMLIPVVKVRHLVGFWMYRYLLVEVDVVKLEDLIMPMEDIPLGTRFLSPSGLH